MRAGDKDGGKQAPDEARQLPHPLYARPVEINCAVGKAWE